MNTLILESGRLLFQGEKMTLKLEVPVVGGSSATSGSSALPPNKCRLAFDIDDLAVD